MASKAAKRARKRKITLPGGDAVPQKPTQGRRTDREDARSATETAATARLRTFGTTMTQKEVKGHQARLNEALRIDDPDKKAAAVKVVAERVKSVRHNRALDPALSTDLGKCIMHLTEGDERAKLLDVWGAISACHRNYRLLYIGQTGDPQGANIGMIPEKMETDPSLRVDLRTHDERVAAAKSAWQAWQARMKALPLPQMIWAVRGALDGFIGEAVLWRDRSPTAHGRLAVEAIRRLNTTA